MGMEGVSAMLARRETALGEIVAVPIGLRGLFHGWRHRGALLRSKTVHGQAARHCGRAVGGCFYVLFDHLFLRRSVRSDGAAYVRLTNVIGILRNSCMTKTIIRSGDFHLSDIPKVPRYAARRWYGSPFARKSSARRLNRRGLRYLPPPQTSRMAPRVARTDCL